MPDQTLLLACLAEHFDFVNRLFNLIAQRLILRIAIKGYWFFVILIIKFETIPIVPLIFARLRRWFEPRIFIEIYAIFNELGDLLSVNGRLRTTKNIQKIAHETSFTPSRIAVATSGVIRRDSCSGHRGAISRPFRNIFFAHLMNSPG